MEIPPSSNMSAQAHISTPHKNTTNLPAGTSLLSDWLMAAGRQCENDTLLSPPAGESSMLFPQLQSSYLGSHFMYQCRSLRVYTQTCAHTHTPGLLCGPFSPSHTVYQSPVTDTEPHSLQMYIHPFFFISAASMSIY